jgi:DNA-binding transcriptional MerR regulator
MEGSIDMADETFLGVGAAAARIGVSASLLRKLERQGILPQPPRVIGSDRRIYRNEDVTRIEQVLKERRATRTSEAAA